MTADPVLVTFNALAGIPCYYARVNAAYGDLSKTHSQTPAGRMRKLEPGYLAQLDACIAELDALAKDRLGPLQAITSGGAYVKQGGYHGKGQAFDLGGLHWAGKIMTTLEVAEDYHAHPEEPGDDYALYLACEAVLHRHFGTILGLHYNADHWNHWHIDPGSAVGFWETGDYHFTRVTFLQATLKHFWDLYPGKLDGSVGPMTRTAIAAIRAQLSLGPLTELESWMDYLLHVAETGLSWFAE